MTSDYPFLFHLSMAALTLAAAWASRRDGRARAWCLAVAAVAGLAAVLAAGLGDRAFGSLRFLAFGLFGYGGATLAAAALSLAPSRRRAAVAFAVLFAAIESIAIDAFLIEPHWLDVRHVRLSSRKIEKPMTIAVLADLQTDEIGDYERSILECVVEARPDLILLAGDYVQEFDNAGRRRLHRELRAALQKIGFGAPLGAYAVRGNVDSDGWRVSFEDTGVTCANSTQSFDVGEIHLTALAIEDSFSRDVTVAPSDRFHIVLGHCPNFALGQIDADLLVAGHTHGGQVRLPFIGPLVTLSRVPRGWAAGVTELGDGKTLVVSRGLGMERGSAPRLRFLCRPELVFVEVVPEPTNSPTIVQAAE